jgi:4'-phosphopantetheinyl transferase
VWLVDLAVAAQQRGPLLEVLSGDEVARAKRFAVEDARTQFVVGRACLRLLLAAFLAAEPRELGFSYGPYGRPTLLGSSAVEFNVSHSAELVAVALTNGTPIGIDVERIRADVSCDALAREHFCPVELGRFLEAPPAARTAVFFDHWVGKEAVAKGLGAGLSIPLQSICVVDDTGSSVSRVRVNDREHFWYVHRFAAARDYAAAVATPLRDARIVLRRWSWPERS